MALTAQPGPTLTFGLTGTSTNGLTYSSLQDYNDQRGPDVSDLGFALADPRPFYSYAPGEPVATALMAFMHGRAYIDYVPFAASTNAIASVTTNSTLTTTFTLQAASSARGTFATNVVAPESGVTLTNVLTLDTTGTGARFNTFGVTGTIQTWAPAATAGRCLSIALSSYLDSPFTVIGRDVYGFKISETVSISSVGSGVSSFGGTTQKAYKYVTQVINSSAPTSSQSWIGTADRFGYPFYTPYYGTDITVRISSGDAVQNAAVALSTANSILAFASSAIATSTTADVRGVYISSVSMAGTYRLQISITPAASALAAVSATDVSPLFGATQFSSV